MAFLNIKKQKIYSFDEVESEDIDEVIFISELLAVPVEWLIDRGYRVLGASPGLIMDYPFDEVFIEFDSPIAGEPPEGFYWDGNFLTSEKLNNDNWQERLTQIYKHLYHLHSWIADMDAPTEFLA